MTNPLILHTNLMQSASSITVTSEATGYEKEKCYDWRTTTFWKATSAGTVYVTVDMGSAVDVDAWGCYAQNLVDNSGTIRFQYSATGAWAGEEVNFGSLKTPTDNTPIMETGTSINMRYFRWVIVSTGAASAIGVLALGEYLETEQGLNIGFEPLSLAQQYETIDSESVEGEFNGRTLKKKPIKGSLQFNEAHTESFMRGDWLTLLRAIEQHPFFVVPLPDSYPNEVYYAKTNGRIQNPRHAHAKHLAMNIPISARVS